MQKNDIIHGFKVDYAQELPEIGATLWRMKYQKNGADLIWLERNDDNKTFAIAFKTIPSDDTGVFHILEHSVLNGSQKYPVKEPFVELLKGSMATFLNAFTAPDWTMYPLSSRNPQDFLNLVDVYLDAVFHPLSITDPHAFRQEGWHYEMDSADDSLKCNGVVYNEMKGAFASYESVLGYELNRLLFPDNCYGCESGGHPDHITELTYENYLASHHRFYHPSNARIVLDGNMDINAVLAKLDSFLCEYDMLAVDSDIPYQSPVTPEEHTAYYEIGPEEDDANKAILAKGWVFGDYSESEKNLGFSILADVVAGTNESPLPKALLEAGLAEDVILSSMTGMQQSYATLTLRNVDPEKKDEIWNRVDEVLKTLVDEGLDRKRLYSALSRMEFRMREKDYGRMPSGIVYAMTAVESWLYGGDPSQNLCIDAVFASLRKKIDEGWFEELLKEALIGNAHRAKLCLLPSKTLGEEKRRAEEERLAGIKTELSSADVDKIIGDFKLLRQRQEAEDTKEQLDTLPKLSVSDIPTECKTVPQNIASVDGVTVLHQPLKTGGITYLNMYFSLSDMTLEELSKITFMTSLIGQSATENHSAIELQSELQGKLGRFSASTSVTAKIGQTKEATPYLTVKLSLLESSKPDAVCLTDEVLNRSDFSDTAFVYNILRQNRLSMEQQIAMRGDSIALIRAASSKSAMGALTEATQGISMLRYLQSSDNSFDDNKDEICTELAALAKTVFKKDRLTLSVTGEYDEAWLKEMIGILSCAPMGDAVTYEPRKVSREGFIIPAEIGFAAKSSNLINLGSKCSGAAKVASQLMTYDYLWNDIRVKGGAYGTHMTARANGDVSLTSYRDPSPSRSLVSFDKAGEVLRDFSENGGDVEKYIISTVAAIEPVLTPRAEGERAAELYFAGIGSDYLQKERNEILGTTNAQLYAFGKILDDICKASGICIVGGKNVIDACDLDTVEAIG